MDIVDMIIESCIATVGEDEWNGMTAQEQHDMIMRIVKTTIDCLDGVDNVIRDITNRLVDIDKKGE